MRISHILKKTEKAVRKIPAFFRSFKTKLHSLKSDSPSFNKLIRSSVALALMVIMLITLTFSWLGDNFSSNIKSNDFITIDADAGLQMNYGEENQPDGSIKINNVLKTGFELQECSSADGRNIFFPTSEYSDSEKEYVIDENGKKTDLIVNTDDLLFREATANDKNTKYISVDFSLSAQGDTDIWISSASKIYCTDSKHEAANALRIAFVDRSFGGKSTVFDNSFAKGYAEQQKHYPVESISETGVAKANTEYRPYSLNEYMYGNVDNNTLFHIKKGETLNASIVVWLEGTDADCDKDVLEIGDIQIEIGLVTSYEEMKPITFIDNTLEKWVDDDDCFVFILDDKGIPHMMTKSENYESDYTWTGYAPSGVTDIKFARYNPRSQSNNLEEWNEWVAGTLGECTTYNAIGHGAGIWKDNLDTKVITLFDASSNAYMNNMDNGSEVLMHLMYEYEDGNKSNNTLDYKMSYESGLFGTDYSNRFYYWQIVVPTDATKLTFKRVNKNAPDKDCGTWALDNISGDCKDNQYITLNSHMGEENFGYWSNRLIYVEDTANIKNNGGKFAGYFYDLSGNSTWVGMNAGYKTSDGKYRYIAAVPDGYTGMVLTRYNSDQNVWDWNYVYSQYRKANNNDTLETEFLTNNLYKITSEINETIDGKQVKTIKGSWYSTTNSW